MTKIYYGCDDVPRGWGRYFALCNAVELDLSTFKATPKIETLNRWRVESPRGFAFILDAGAPFVEALNACSLEWARGTTGVGEAAKEALANKQLSAELIKAWEATLEQAHALAAKAIILKTPLDFSPNPTNRALMERIAAELVSNAKPALIWESQGMWPVEQTRDFAEANGLIYPIDPFMAQRDKVPFTHGSACFILTERAGMRREFDVYDMEQIIEWAEAYDRVFILLRGRFQWEHARELQRALQE